MSELFDKVDRRLLENTARLREDLHRHPELAFEEKRTSAVVIEQLEKAGVEVVSRGVAGTGVVGLLRGAQRGSTVALRADMDALPLEEDEGCEYRSLVPGVMHACGHDGHTAVLLGTAEMLASRRKELPGQIKFIFQPAEEKGNGAREMVKAGVLSDPPVVDAIFALHARPQIRPGQIELDRIPNAATNPFVIKVRGRGTHAAYPHQGVDPVAIGSQIVTALQQVVARQVAPSQAAVVTVGCFQAGSQSNVIPGEALLKGTIRTRDPDVRERVIASVHSIAKGLAGSFGAGCEFFLGEGTPRLRNDDDLLDLVRRVGERTLGAENVLWAREPTMGGEDFSFYLAEQNGVPGCMFRLGVSTSNPIHTPGFDFGSEALEPGMLMMANLAIHFLDERS